MLKVPLEIKPSTINVNKNIELLMQLEKTTGTLPKYYRTFLLYFSSNIIFSTIVIFKSKNPSQWADNQGFDTIDYFYGLTSSNNGYTIFEAMNIYKALNTTLLSIGFSSGGNQICLCIKGKRKGSIWFWDHEASPIFNEEEIVSGLTFIASNFKEFIEMLIVEKNTSPSKAISGYLDF